jgi:CxxC-x17-CxxC domain-containing protein
MLLSYKRRRYYMTEETKKELEKNETTKEAKVEEKPKEAPEQEAAKEEKTAEQPKEEAPKEEPKPEMKKEEPKTEEKDNSGREMHKAVCADCGKECEVPFKPIEGKKIYCRDCYRKHKPRRF